MFVFARFRIQARRRAKELYHVGLYHDNLLSKVKEYSQPSSWLIDQSLHIHFQLASRGWAFVMSVRLILKVVFVHGDGSRLPKALEEKSGTPQRKTPCWFS